MQIFGRRPQLGSILHLVRGAFIAGAAIIAYHGWTLLDHNWARNYDAAVRWYGLATLLLVGAVVPTPPFSLPAASELRAFLSRHRWELAALAIVLALGVFMRVYDIGHFPPKAGTSFEEAQTGGNAYAVLHNGRRPVNFALTDYTGALGFTLFGYGTAGLRLPFLLFGIFSLVAFYLLVRLLLSAPAALFATALLAVNRWDAFSARIADELFSGMNLSILAALLLIAALRTRNGLIVVALGLAIGLLNYEYTGYRYIPLLLLATLAITLPIRFAREGLARRRVLWPGLGRRWWLAPVFALALFIAITPVIVDGLHGSNAYYEALERHRSETQKTTFFGVPATWERNLKWSFEVFLPTGPGKDLAQPPLTAPGKRMLDPVTGGLAFAAMAYALLSFHKPYRLLFSLWFFIGLVFGGVLPNNFYVPRFTAILPAMFVMIGFLTDDALRLVSGRRLRLASYGMLSGLAAWALFANVGALRSQADDVNVRREYADPFVSACSLVRDLGSDTYTYVWIDSNSAQLAFLPSDFDWACQGIVGEPLDWPVALSPLELPSESQVALVYLAISDYSPDPLPILRVAYPQVAWRVDREENPFGTYILRAYIAPTAELAQQRGLLATYLGASTPSSRVDSSRLFVSGGSIDWPDSAIQVNWDGLVLVQQEGELALAPMAQIPMEISIDGLPMFSNESATPRVLDAGWHAVHMSLRQDAGASIPALGWLDARGDQTALVEGDLFAMDPADSWKHVITAKTDVEELPLRWQRIDPYPSPGLAPLRLPSWLTESFHLPRGRPAELLHEEWQSRWQVPETGAYQTTLTVQNGTATVYVDGVAAGVVEASTKKSQDFSIILTTGEHAVEIQFQPSGGNIAGVTMIPPEGISIQP